MTTARDAVPVETTGSPAGCPAHPLDCQLSRRRLIRNAAVAGTAVAAGAALAACGSGQAPTTTGRVTLGKTSTIPVGGGVIFAQQDVVVTQPAAGTFKAFSATCTHLGCQVNAVANGLIQCPCHGSMYSIADGSVKA
ncbi:MAG TPA: Rieske (2Fe-2S) protein, partial [Pseudonocardiaceae bacterium]|nr:Rieske (2Fe-2S) protein [Pseudonocardiaceae bacterium]